MESTFEHSHWARVVGQFRNVCVLHREGKTSESRRILEKDLRRSIAEWSKVSPRDAQTKRSRLEQMFGEEQRRVDDAWMVQSMVVRQLNEQILPVLSDRLAAELRTALSPTPLRSEVPVEAPPPPETDARVAFDNVAGMIDILLSSEAGRKQRLDAYVPA